MAAPVLTPSLVKLRDAFNARCPSRDKASDGWIGDKAHQASTSGHNPDDTPGVKAEYSDSDSIPEVRAIDVDADLRCGGLTMLQVIRAILSDPASLKRLRYIIFCPPGGRPTIWSRTTSWQPRAYNGSNRHDKHAHFSGDPLDDANKSPWTVVATVGLEDDMPLTDADIGKLLNWNLTPSGTKVTVGQALLDAHRIWTMLPDINKAALAGAERAHGLMSLTDVREIWSEKTPQGVDGNVLRQALEQIHAAVLAIQPGQAPPVDPQVLAVALRAALASVLPGLSLEVTTPAGPTDG